MQFINTSRFFLKINRPDISGVPSVELKAYNNMENTTKKSG
jgi:hypothetical protein